MQDNIGNNTSNSLVPLGSKGLVRLENSSKKGYDALDENGNQIQIKVTQIKRICFTTYYIY